jgi:predicted glutamine amidotransferase
MLEIRKDPTSPMCRFTLFLGEPIVLGALLVAPKNSLVHQSLHSEILTARVHGDGFGVAWYAPQLSPEPAVYRCVTPAWNNANLRHLTRVIESPVILAHVRAASENSVISESNCHPFSAGRLAFAHNGYLSEFPRIRREISNRLSERTYGAIHGSTDSEYIFALFREHYGRAAGAPGPAKLASALRTTIEDLQSMLEALDIDKTSYMNLAVTDGEVAAACRVTTGPPEEALSLHVCVGKRYSIEAGDCQLSHSTEGSGAVLISSEPLCEDQAWRTIEPNHLVTATAAGGFETEPL